jgi:hypothetical protein
MTMFTFLDGYKTYIGGAVVFIAGGLRALEIIDEASYQALLAVGLSIGISGLRAALRR